MMDPSMEYPDSPMEPDDMAYPCKGCGQVRLHEACIGQQSGHLN
jgi:hypothetical protein